MGNHSAPRQSDHTGSQSHNFRMNRRQTLAALAAGLLLPRTLLATEATSSREAQDDALRLIPFDKLTEPTQRKIWGVIERPTIFRRMPTHVVNCDPDMHTFLIRNPEVVVNIWQVMGISNVQVKRTSDFSWSGSDGAGTTCQCEVVYGTDDMHLLYADGFYEGPLFKRKLTGRCVLALHSQAGVGREREPLIGERMDMFLTLDNIGVDLVAKTLHPMIVKTADANFTETTNFLAKISQSSERNGQGMQNLGNKLTNVQPPIREKFIKTAGLVNERAALRDSRSATVPVSTPVREGVTSRNASRTAD
jgi:hypothetical protein